MGKFKCQVCGYIHDGDEAPDKCPKCGAPKEQFETLANDAAELIENSRLTNDIHAELASVLGHMVALSEEGIEENLDPNCVAIFERAKKEGHELIQSIKAELQGHMKKGKWG